MCNIFFVKKFQFDLLFNGLIKWWRIIFYRQNIYGKNRINFMFILHSVYKMKINVKLCKIHLLKHETFRTLVLVILIGANLTQSHSCFIVKQVQTWILILRILLEMTMFFFWVSTKKNGCDDFTFYFFLHAQFFVCLQF